MLRFLRSHWLLCLVLISMMLVGLLPQCITLSKINYRPAGWKLTTELKEQIMFETKGMSAEQIAHYSVELTAHMLKYTVKKPVGNRQNCVGYARACSAISNYAFHCNHLQSKSSPVVGKVQCGPIDLCKVLQRCVPSEWQGFVKDHDFVEFVFADGSIVYMDACIYDILFTKCRTVK